MSVRLSRSREAGKLFRRGWLDQKRIPGEATGRPSSRLGRHRQMARAAQRHQPAVFKMVRGGGTKTVGQLAGQMAYLFSQEEKCLSVHDSRGTYDGERTLTSEQIEAAAHRWADSWRGFSKSGQTTHLVMSFPHRTRIDQVDLIAREICEEKLGGRFDYMIAVHGDRDHPHAHILVNRRGEDGQLFFLSRGTEFSYEAFREAMVDHAAVYGVQLEATKRTERGLATRGVKTGTWQAEKEAAVKEGRAFAPPEGRKRIGRDAAYAMREIADSERVYRGLSAAATQQNLEKLAAACDRAAELLGEGRHLEADGEVYMQTEEIFDQAQKRMAASMKALEDRIEQAAPNHRPAMESQRDELYAKVAHMAPQSAHVRGLTKPATDAGVYARQNSEAARSQLTAVGRDKLDRALEGTGINPTEVENRMRVGAASLSTEREWIASDLRTIADTKGLDLRDEKQLDQALDTLDRVYDRVARDYGVEDAVEKRLAAVEARAQTADDRAGVSETARLAAQDRAQEMRAAAERPAVVGNGMSDADAAALRMHRAPVGEEDERRLREAVEKTLSADALTRLREGDASALRGAGTRQDQLELARDYLKASKAQEAVVQRVNNDLAEERTRRGHDTGVDHG